MLLFCDGVPVEQEEAELLIIIIIIIIIQENIWITDGAPGPERKHLRVHALAAAAEDDVRSFLGFLFLLQKSHGTERSVTAAHLLQQL